MASIVESADGTLIGYESFGDGPPMLLVHGTSATQIRWAPVREKLGSRYRINSCEPCSTSTRIRRQRTECQLRSASAASLSIDASSLSAVVARARGNRFSSVNSDQSYVCVTRVREPIGSSSQRHR
jgi:hypothetical protein